MWLGGELRHTIWLVYSEGLDLPDDHATQAAPGGGSAGGTAVPSGRFSALGRQVDPDEHRSTVSPSVVKLP
jgi:XRE family transcriptional regulator, fatty acid utilization regulator